MNAQELHYRMLGIISTTAAYAAGVGLAVSSLIVAVGAILQ